MKWPWRRPEPPAPVNVRVVGPDGTTYHLDHTRVYLGEVDGMHRFGYVGPTNLRWGRNGTEPPHIAVQELPGMTEVVIPAGADAEGRIRFVDPAQIKTLRLPRPRTR